MNVGQHLPTPVLDRKAIELEQELEAEKNNLAYHQAEKAAGSLLEDAEISESRKNIELIEAALAARYA